MATVAEKEVSECWNTSGSIIDQRTMELGSPRDMVRNPEEHPSFMGSPSLIGLARMVLENHRKQILTAMLESSVLPLLVVPITAAGLQGEQPLANRTM